VTLVGSICELLGKRRFDAPTSSKKIITQMSDRPVYPVLADGCYAGGRPTTSEAPNRSGRIHLQWLKAAGGLVTPRNVSAEESLWASGQSSSSHTTSHQGGLRASQTLSGRGMPHNMMWEVCCRANKPFLGPSDWPLG
jgi:hypothetical protein